jgi:uncharacterized cupredoxin-like copper-binding protein
VFLRRVLLIAVLPTLLLAGAAHARGLTTRPTLVFDIRVTMSDERIAVDPRRAPRGVEARFIIKNEGSKKHNFTLNGKKSPAGMRQAVSETLDPGKTKTVQLLLDFRARIPYLGGLDADRAKPGMRGVFVIS